MKNIKYLVIMAVSLVAIRETKSRASATEDLQITSFNITNKQASLTWSGGRPAYQVQARSNFTADWSNVGGPTSDTFALVPASGAQTYYRVVSDFTARYQVVFYSIWSQATHPTNWPGNAHWSGLVGGTHNNSVHFFREGEPASEGIRNVAELGQKTALLNEITPAIANGSAQFQLSGPGLTGPFPAGVAYVFPQPMARDYPLVTLVSMIAPSPDWFAGVDSLSLIANGEWVTNLTVTLYGLDAGTDSGASYGSADQVTVPRGVVARFTGFPAIQNGVIVPFGTFTFTRLD